MLTSFSATSLGQGLTRKSGAPLAPWLDAVRAADREALSVAAVPGPMDEEWRSVPLAGFWRRAYAPVPVSSGKNAVPRIIPDAVNVIVRNGHFSGEVIGGVPPGLQILSGPAAVEALAVDQTCLTTFTDNDAALFSRLNRSLFGAPLVIVVKQGVAVMPLVHVVHVTDTAGAACFARLMVRTEKAASISILETVMPSAGLDFLDVPVADIVVGEGARVEHAHLRRYGPSAVYVGALRAWVSRDATFRSFLNTSGAGIFRLNASAILQAEGASAFLNGLHALAGDAHADSHTYIEHVAPDTTSNQLYKCVLDGESTSLFNGRVKVHREAQRTNSYQLNKNLLLSPSCRADTRPRLEIFADDVKCTHGATIGQLNAEQLLYLRTRAIDAGEASRMLVQGFMDEALATVVHPVMRQYAV